MIKSLINRIYEHFKKVAQEKEIREIVSHLNEDDWNRITAGVILNLYTEGEKQYKLLNNYIDNNYPTIELFNIVNSEFDGKYQNLLIRSNNLTEKQTKLLNACKSRKLKTNLVAILETIDEYDKDTDFDYHYSSIDYSDNN